MKCKECGITLDKEYIAAMKKAGTDNIEYCGKCNYQRMLNKQLPDNPLKHIFDRFTQFRR